MENNMNQEHQCVVCGDSFLLLAGGGVVGVCHNGHDWCRDCLAAAVEVAEEAARRLREVRGTQGYQVDRSVIRVAMNSRNPLYQFCQRCHRLVATFGGCNHMSCVCGHHFCIICGERWPEDGGGAGQAPLPLCHPFYGAEEEHELRVPAAIQERLDAEARIPPPAFSYDTTEAIVCHHNASRMLCLRLRRDLDRAERGRSRCDVCGRVFRGFLLQCQDCSTLLCLDCRDAIWDERLWPFDTGSLRFPPWMRPGEWR
ncbi:hypothetical protein MFIFM68171_01100 [Madurella fahalii]|uniref:IBR domain-containing protein n=1 Tax=Madurella fahalii TaxID=1157608 RepID=A0ABQ0G012_9PEZI